MADTDKRSYSNPRPNNGVMIEGTWWIAQTLGPHNTPAGHRAFIRGSVLCRGIIFPSIHACRNHFEGGDMAALMNLAEEAKSPST